MSAADIRPAGEVPGAASWMSRAGAGAVGLFLAPILLLAIAFWAVAFVVSSAARAGERAACRARPVVLIRAARPAPAAVPIRVE